MSEFAKFQIIENPNSKQKQAHQEKMQAFVMSRTGESVARRPQIIFIQLKIDNEIKGSVRLVKELDLLAVESIWIDEDIQKMGYGVKLYIQIEEFAQQQMCSRIVLSTYDFFKSLSFWLRMGFQIVGEIPNCSNGHHLYYLQKPLVAKK